MSDMLSVSMLDVVVTLVPQYFVCVRLNYMYFDLYQSWSIRTVGKISRVDLYLCASTSIEGPYQQCT